MADKKGSFSTTNGQRRVLLRIGDIASQIAVPTHQHLVPFVDPEELALTKARFTFSHCRPAWTLITAEGDPFSLIFQSVRQVLRWLLQKEKLGQDAFLLGFVDAL
ncbi:hypothetical protein AMAG_18696 [Allomyces macrogynus ATCC 38327]|uniref:Uncharacterized protein n=1 Tax=Allomyces macrogynus (strain ATCC 38327) TaxID=578462 RepID=A0A0L0SEB6_ALLM3|nr:hypothetical protein AMAG_18696 [Allomyces macrogynus ATCC 38327]|eukprot:KNE60826.1 hypothetical protein AMAG_18696 [Allomyces macrogynus ATCC 38327]